MQRKLAGKRALEIGGPSDIFGDDGLLQIYSILRSVDNCLFSARTIWTGEVQIGRRFQYHPRKDPGTQLICEATDLSPVPDSSYEAVLASHCLEHVANPIRALEEWKRVLVKGGFLLLVLPHKDGTFDWRRPVTPLEHMIQDYERNTTEDDLTHLPEILALHDLEKDPPAGSPEQFKQRCLVNSANRAIHHHVFDMTAAVALLDHAGFQLTRVATFEPFHIVMLASKCGKRADNSRFLRPDAEFRTRSPFHSDRLSSIPLSRERYAEGT
jgi:SAM-dependent methyltransferase